MTMIKAKIREKNDERTIHGKDQRRERGVENAKNSFHEPWNSSIGSHLKRDSIDARSSGLSPFSSPNENR